MLRKPVIPVNSIHHQLCRHFQLFLCSPKAGATPSTRRHGGIGLGWLVPSSVCGGWLLIIQCFLSMDEQKVWCLSRWVASKVAMVPVYNPCPVVYLVQHCWASGLPLHSPLHTCRASGSGMFQNWVESGPSLHFRNYSFWAGPQRLSLPFSWVVMAAKLERSGASLSFDLETRTRFRSLTWFCLPVYPTS